jgi:serine phosphatase RsbU (regulator of sigma subunit)
VQGLVGITLVQGQHYPTDSLRAQLQTLKQGTEAYIQTQIHLANTLNNRQPNQAIAYAQEALQGAQKLKKNKLQAEALQALGHVYRLQGSDFRALEFFLDALRIFERLKDSSQIAATYNSIGNIYFLQKKYEVSLAFYQRTLRLARQLKDEQSIANALNNIGNIYYYRDRNNTALRYFTEALALNRKLGNVAFSADNLLNISAIFMDEGNYDIAYAYADSALVENTQIDHYEGQAAALQLKASISMIRQKNEEAETYAARCLELAYTVSSKRYIKAAAGILAEIAIQKQVYDEALIYTQIVMAYKDSLSNEESKERIARLEAGYLLEKKQAEIDTYSLEKEKDLYVRNMLWQGVLALGIVVLILLWSRSRSQQQAQKLRLANTEVNIKNQELREQKQIIEEKKQDIESSIRYALRIQQAILPTQEEIALKIPQHCIFFKPRDVVSGDFYWFAETDPEPVYTIDPELPNKASVFQGFTNEKQVVAAVDCTGHGVPGAFMSLIGSSLLNEIVTMDNVTSADQILNYLHRNIQLRLRQQGLEGETYDGMDIALCVIDREAKTMEFAGANNPLVYFQKGEMHIINGDKQGIGGYSLVGKRTPFSKHTIDLQEPTTFYLFSDGFQDQFGGIKNRKFMKKNFYQLLADIHQEPMHKQAQLLEKALDEWKGTEPQVDDILVIGMRL